VDYFPGYFAKSGVFGAAAAHGVVPITLRDAGSAADGLIDGTHYLQLAGALGERSQVAQERFAQTSRDVYTWYSGHSLARHAELWNRLCVAEAAGNREPQLAGTQV
jgi:hypothetical protein